MACQNQGLIVRAGSTSCSGKGFTIQFLSDLCCSFPRVVALHNPPRLASGEICFSAGIFLNLVLGPVLDVSGYAFAPASIISPFTGFNIISNSLLLGHYSYMHLPPRTCSNSAPDSFVRAPPRPKQLLVRVAPITLGEQVT